MLNLSAAIAFHARRAPERPALFYRGRAISYGSFDRRIQRLGPLLAARGVGPGDRVAAIMRNSPAFLEIAYGASRQGAVFVPVNFRLSADEAAYVLDHSGARLVFVDDDLAPLVAGRSGVVTVDAEAQEDSRKLVPDRVEPVDPVPCAADALMRLVYTSGTTSRPKGVMHTYANWHAKTLDHIVALALGPEDRLLAVGPLYHVGAFDLPGVAALMAGGAMCVIRAFSPEAVLDAIQRHRLTGGWMAPVMTGETLAFHGRGGYDTSSLRWLVGGGARTPEARIRAFAEAFPGARYVDAYGLTESGAGDTFMEAGREIEKIGSTGRSVPHVEIAIRTDAGATLAAGEEGEICLRGPKITPGYWNDPEATAEAFHADGFLCTGDIGHMDEDGFLYLTDRRKDLIISGGENIASSEVERVILDLDAVADVAVIARADDRWGERPVAVCVLKPGGSLNLGTLQQHCRARLAGFKVPDDLVLREALPRNPSGKVLKRILRDEHG